MIGIQEEKSLDMEKTALVVIDLQNGIVKNKQRAPYSGEQVVSNASKLAEAFTQKGAFVVLVRVSTHDGKDMLRVKTDYKAPRLQYQEGWDLHVPELAHHTGAYIITKRQWGAFFGTDLDLQLRRRGIDTIVLCGISTALGVDTTAREAYQFGYHQIFAEDAMTAEEKGDHDYVCNRIFPRIGRVRSTEQVIEMLD
ncbi:MAG: hydrolase [Ethanoligenens sp.]